LATIGTTRRIDQLGRVVVPAELRRSLGIHEGDLLDISAEDGRLVLRKVSPSCAICGQTDELVDMHDKHLCKGCVREIKLEPTCAFCGRLDKLMEMHDNHVCADCAREISLV
jgi:AbrB family transcriptional regulator, transcriptional pleiotropic regulator of transition state genes